MPGIRVIAVPYELGRLRDGVGLGPEALLAAGAIESLAAHGADVDLRLVELDGPDDNEVDASFTWIARLADAVRAARKAERFPVVLSGSCLASIGVVAGLGEERPGVVWFDAHGDFNEPETAVYGYLDGMPLAILVGDAWQGLAAQIPGARPLDESAVILAGARAFDAPELARLERSQLTRVSAGELDDPEALTRAVGALDPEPTGIYAHVDLDVLDVSVAPVNRYSAPGGVWPGPLRAALEALLADGRVRAVSLTAYEPDVDPDARVPPIAMDLLDAVAASKAAT